MDKIAKALQKLSPKEREAFLMVMNQLKQDYRKIPNLVALTGYKNWYRIRIGRYRLLFKIHAGRVEIRRIAKRNEETYKRLN